MTPPMSQNSVVISVNGATPPVFAFLFRAYYAISEHVKGPKIYGAEKCLFLSALLRMFPTVSGLVRPRTTDAIVLRVFAGGQEIRSHPVRARVATARRSSPRLEWRGPSLGTTASCE